MPTQLRNNDILFNDGTTQSSAGGNYIMRIFNGPGTWTKPANLKAVKVSVIGAGGGGGGNRAAPGYGNSSAPGAGGGGSIRYMPASSIPGPVAVTVGAGGAGGPAPGTANTVTTGSTGGTTSFGAFLSATGGSGGGSASAPGTRGVGSGGDLNFNGRNIDRNYVPTPAFSSSGGGGNFLYESAGGREAGAQNVTGENGEANKGGGGGGSASTFPSPRPGGNGGSGVVIVEEFY